MHRAGRRGDVPCPGGLEGLGLGTRSSSARPLSSLCTDPELIKCPHLHPRHSSLLSSRPRALWQALGTEALFWMGGSVRSCASSRVSDGGLEPLPKVWGGGWAETRVSRGEVGGGIGHLSPDFPAGSVAEGPGQLFPPQGASGESDVGPSLAMWEVIPKPGSGRGLALSQFSCRHRCCIAIQCGGHWLRGLRFH